MSELEHSFSDLRSARKKVFKEFQVLFRVGWKLKENGTILLSKRSQCDSKSLSSFDRSLPKFQNVSNLPRRLEQKPETAPALPGPCFNNCKPRRAEDGPVDSYGLEP